MHMQRARWRTDEVINSKATWVKPQALSRASLDFKLLLSTKHHAKMIVYNWFSEFKRGLVNLNDEFSDGRPSTAVNNKNIDAVRLIIKISRRLIYHEIRHP
ncbi:hypothetical protein EVAR_80402_1 [Eumeta japonica]|uniref:Mos1 transposase HTH domain-containing protein n=1 Tax=Eumeta variegata TaxID=151549 RepID=A0A4C1VHR3_EUMVA|nr:hypothetical protein EVAR_80402_1 [Eumeta japonica]